MLRSMSWISARAHVERSPARVSLIFAFGELPEGWAKPERPRAARVWIGVLGLLLIAPFTLLFAGAALRLVGVGAAYDWFAASPVAIVAASVSLFIGLPIAFVLNAWPITRVGMRRRAGQLEGLLALEFVPLQLAVVLVSLLVG